MRHWVSDLISLCHNVLICKLGLDHAPSFRAYGEGHVCESVASASSVAGPRPDSCPRCYAVV